MAHPFRRSLTFLALAALCVAPGRVHAAQALLPGGMPAPDFSLPTLPSGQISLSQLRGHIVIVDFWASWCGPCNKKMPGLAAIADEYGQQQVVVLAVNVFDKAGPFTTWVQANGTYPFAYAFDPTPSGQGGIGDVYHVSAIPTTYIIDPYGNIATSGCVLDDQEIVNALSQLRARTASEAPPPVDPPGVCVLHFDDLPSMDYNSHQAVPAYAMLSNQYARYGAVFSSTAAGVAVTHSGIGHAVSGYNCIGGVSTDGSLSYDAANPITITFVDPAKPTAAATTTYVSVRGDLRGGAGDAKLVAFDIAGKQIAEDSEPDSGGEVLKVSGAGIHSVKFTGTSDDSGIAIDDVTYAPVTPAPVSTPSK